MAKVDEIISEIKSHGSEAVKKVLLKHGAKEPFFGTKVEDLKKIQKKIKNEQELAMQLYDSGISEAMYLAGLVADGGKMSKAQLNDWVKKAYWSMLSEFTVPWVASENKDGWQIGLEWIESKEEKIATSGWNTLSAWISMKKDEELDLKKIEALLKKIEKEIHKAPNRVRYVMNGFVIAAGTYVQPVRELAIAIAQKIDVVYVDMNGTSCKVPPAVDYINKTVQRNGGKKKKTAKC